MIAMEIRAAGGVAATSAAMSGRLLGDGRQIAPARPNPKELQPLWFTCSGAADGAWPAYNPGPIAPVFKLHQYQCQ